LASYGGRQQGISEVAADVRGEVANWWITEVTRNILSALQAKFRGSAFRAADYPTNSLKRAQNQSAFGVPQRSGQGSQCEWKPVVQVWIPKEKGCVIHSDHPYNAPMAMGRREQQRRQEEFWIAHTELPRTAAHPFYEQLNRLLEARGFDEWMERARKYSQACADSRGRTQSIAGDAAAAGQRQARGL